MKIAYIVPGSYFKSESGSTYHIQQVVRGIQKAEYEIVVFDARSGQPIDPFAPMHGKNAANHVRWRTVLKKQIPGWGRSLFSEVRFATRELMKIGKGVVKDDRMLTSISRSAPDIIYQRLSFASNLGIWAARYLSIPLVFEVNAPILYELSRYGKLYFPNMAKRLHSRILQQADAITVVSNVLKDYLIASGDLQEEKIKVIPNGVDVSLFRGVDGSKLRENFSFDDDDIVVGFVGALKPWHGVDILLDLASSVDNKKVKFLIIGSGPMLDYCQRFIQQHRLTDQVFMTGHLIHSEVPAYLAAVDIAVAPYPNLDLFYFSPIKLFEYMAAGKAIVASKLGQIAEVLEDKQTALLVTPGSVEELKQAILYLVANPAQRENLGRAVELQAQDYTWEHNIAQVIEVLETTLVSKV
jgi:glycosyltransferase involved in cell wall biosynthesis